MVKAILIIVPVIIILYVLIAVLPASMNNSNFEEDINNMLRSIDGITALDANEEYLINKVIFIGKDRGITLKRDDFKVTWERYGDQLTVGVDLDIDYDHKIFGFEKGTSVSIHSQESVAVDVAEEQRRIAEREANESEEADLRARHRAECEALGSGYEWDGVRCLMIIYTQ
ncbi:MAG: hypothetical protein JSV21_01555 [Nitrospirota bacterium]|nr:MAG: hypothetical protein JSV21_01555 [Nitrospirota bacterium]